MNTPATPVTAGGEQDAREKVAGSAYGTGAPTYENADQQKSRIDGRLKVATGIRDRAQASGDDRTYRKWAVIVDELLDRRREVMGR